MNYKRTVSILLGLLVLGLGAAAADDSAMACLNDGRIPRIEFTSYLGLGGGAGLVKESALPSLYLASGFQFAPWISAGAFVNLQSLSYFAKLVPESEAFAAAYGSELILTPWAEALMHPYLRAAIGGISLGYVDQSVTLPGSKRHPYVELKSFSAALSGGAELNLAPNWRLAAWAGWRFTDGADLMGLKDKDMSGPEGGVLLRLVFNTVWY